MHKQFLCGAVLILLVSGVFALEHTQTRLVQFAPETSSATIQGRLTGYESIHYAVEAKAGQSLAIVLNSDNSGNYFNLFEPGKTPGDDRAWFIGATEGTRFEGTLPADGVYIVQVYIIRSAARRGETATFTLDVAIVSAEQEDSS